MQTPKADFQYAPEMCGSCEGSAVFPSGLPCAYCRGQGKLPECLALQVVKIAVGKRRAPGDCWQSTSPQTKVALKQETVERSLLIAICEGCRHTGPHLGR